MTDGHGDDLYRYEGLVRHNFSSNIYAHADLRALKAHLSGHLDLIGRYPEPEPRQLERLIAVEGGTDAANVMCTNGATEAIYLVARCFGTGTRERRCVNVISRPTFSEYADACRAAGCDVVSDGDASCCRKVRWICNPNNPDGTVTDKGRILELADRCREDLFVIDQSYEHYTLRPMIADSEAARRPNIILIHSMTKRFCVPGLRIGYIAANCKLADKLKALRAPWSVNALAIEAGCYLVRSKFTAIPDVRAYMEEAQRLRRNLESIEGIDVLPTQTNFMLASIKGHEASRMKEFLVKRHGILVRDASNFDGLDASFFRVAAQGREEDDLLVEGIKDYIKHPDDT